MKHNFATTKTVLISLLLVLAICCLAVSVALTYQQQVAEAEETQTVASGQSSVMPIAAPIVVTDETTLKEQFTNGVSGTVVQLGNDITYTSSLFLTRAGVELTLDLNGKTLATSTRTARNIYVSGEGTKLTIKDSSGNNSGKITDGAGLSISGKSTLVMDGGTITGNVQTNPGGGLIVNGSSTFIMNDGVITDNEAGGNGGGLHLSGTSTFNMYGGTISNNRSTNSVGDDYTYGGAGLCVLTGSTFNLYNGTITNNTAAEFGGGVYMGGSTSKFNMQGGTISDNTAKNGGGVFIGAGTFEMSSGTLYQNSATGGNGGGVYITGSNAKFNMTGGAISNSTVTNGHGGGVYVNNVTAITISNTAIIADNQTNGTNFSGGGIYLEQSTLNLTGGTISGNTVTSGQGGGLYLCDNSTLNISGNANIFNNAVTGSGRNGGGVYVSNSDFTMTGGNISSNKAPSKDGGGVYVYQGTFTMEAGTISGNTCSAAGGGVYVNSSTFDMSGGTISSNIANIGAGVWVTGTESDMNMTGGTITNNTATNYGGGVAVYGVTFTMSEGATISKNTAKNNGGGVYITNSNATQGGAFILNGGTISGNEAGSAISNGGGGLYITGALSTFTMTGGAFRSNMSNGIGGGMYLTGGSTSTISGATIANNTCNLGNGGGLHISTNAKVTIDNTMISGNEAGGESGNGGGIFVGSSSTFTMKAGVTLTRNSAQVAGGGLYLGGGTFLMEGGTIFGNSAQRGGGVMFGSGTISLSGAPVIKNNTLLDYVTASNFDLYGNKITVGALTAGAEIYVINSAAQSGAFTFATDVATDVSKYFHADDTTKCIGYKSNSLDIDTHSMVWDTSNETTHVQKCAHCGLTANSGNHNFNYIADSGANTHHGECQDCGKTLSSVAHELDFATYVDESEHKGYCKVCKTEVTASHNPTGEFASAGYHDYNSHWQICTVCAGKVNETTHTWDTWSWTQGDSSHSKECPVCKETSTQSHNYSSWTNKDSSEHKRTCTDCSKEVTAPHEWGKIWTSDDKGNHYHECAECDAKGESSAHTMRKIAEIPATCVDNGIHAYYICTTCGDKFTDLKGLNIIEDLDNWKENGGKIESLGDEHHFVNGVCVNCGDIDPEVKQELENEIQDAIDDVQDKIDELEGKKSDPGLSQEEEDKLKELEEALKRLQQALEDLENADNSQDVGGIIEDAKGAIGGAADAMDDGELKAAKKSAQEKIEEAVTKAEEAIDNKVASGEITAEEGANLKKEVRDEAKKAKDLIDQATSTDDVEKEQKKAIGEDGERGTIGDVVAKADTLHNWNNDEWKFDATGHWHECTDCKLRKDVTEHHLSSTWTVQNGRHYKECTDGCGYKYGDDDHVLVEHKGYAATCTEHGMEDYWQCAICKAYFEDEKGMEEIPDFGVWSNQGGSGYIDIVADAHKWDSAWHYDSTTQGHYHVCEYDGSHHSTDVQSHNFEGAYYDDGNGKHYQKCADCGAAGEGVAHNMQRVGEVPATCTDSGSKAYFICTDCAGIYANSNGTNKIPNLNDWLASEGKIPSLAGGSHDYDPDTGICSVCGSLDPEVKEELEQKLKDAQSQLEDKKRELEEKKSQPGGLSPEEEAKLKELEEKLKQLQDALDDLENANSSDNMGDIVDNANGALGDAADETDDTLAQDKLDALDKLEQAYEDQKQEVTNGSLTAEQQKDLLAQLADAYSEAQKKIKQATSKEEADKAAEDGSKALEELVENYNPDTVPGGSHTHTWTTKFDDKYHWEECTDASCNARKEVTAHDDNGWKVDANGNHYKYCDTCSNEYLKDKHVLVEHKGYAATCTEHGMEDYWQCAICKAYFEDEKGMDEIPDFGVWSNQGGSGYIDIVADAHKWDSAWHYDSDTQGHYHVCEYDGSHHSTDVQSHNFEGAYYDDGNGKHYQKCADCGAAGEGVAHNMQRVAEVPATCTDNGSKAYFICTDCAGIYSNAKGTNKIPNLSDWLESEGKIPSLNNGSHDYDEETGICKVCGSLNPEVKEELQKKLEDAQQQLEEKKRELEEKRDSGGGLSKEEEEKLKELEEKLQQLQDALDELENANGSSNAGDIVDDVNNALGGAADATDDDGSLSDAKLKALDDLEKEYEKQQQAVTGGSLSSEQQTDLLAQLADAYKEAQKKIKQATTKQEAEAAADAGAEDLRDLVENYDPDTVPGAGHKHTWTTKYDNENHWDECTSCSARQNVQAHDESNWMFSGYNHYKHCETCGHDYGVAKHTLVEYKETSSTCVTHGHEAYWHCPVCESYFTNASGSAASRIGGQSEFDVWYTGAGQKDLDTENGHRWSKTLTHDASGHWYECLNEGCSEKRDYQDHRDSSFYDGLKWTFIDNDYHGKVCDTCGEVITKTVHGNGVTSWTTNGTETHSGECATCNHKVTKAHDFAAGNYDKNDDGHWTACVDCNQADDDFEEHRVNLWIDDGDTLHHHGTCLDCGKELTRGHSWRWVQEPDSEEFRRTCSACLYADPTTQGHIVDEWIPVDGTQHKGNCLAEGHTNEELYDDHHFFTNYDGTYHWQECEECGYIDEETRAAHVLLTGTSNGTETHRGTCTECGQEITNQNHTWVMKHDDINHWQECTVCGEKRDEIKHTVEWTTDGDSTHTGTCSVCHEEITHDHTWLFGFCTECRDALGNYAEAESDVGIAAAAIVAQLFALIAVAAIVSRRMKK